MSMSNKIL
jgi:hypothetical protein